MKTYLVALCLVGAVLAKHSGEKGKEGDQHPQVPGCENADAVKDIKASTCCPALPKLFEKNVWRNCSKTCERSDNEFCCKSDCYLKSYNLVDNAGKFDPTAAKTLIKSAVNNDASWPIDKIVDDCVAGAPAKLKELEDKMAAYKNEEEKDGKPKDDKSKDGKGKDGKSKKGGHSKDMKQCPNPENFIIGQCIRREMIIQCPGWTKSDTCDSLMTFAKSCPMYPFRGCDGKHENDVEKKSKKNDKKSEKPAKKQKREADDEDQKADKKKEREAKKAAKKAKKEQKKKDREAKKAEKKDQ